MWSMAFYIPQIPLDAYKIQQYSSFGVLFWESHFYSPNLRGFWNAEQKTAIPQEVVANWTNMSNVPNLRGTVYLAI